MSLKKTINQKISSRPVLTQSEVLKGFQQSQIDQLSSKNMKNKKPTSKLYGTAESPQNEAQFLPKIAKNIPKNKIFFIFFFEST